jgi:hypothetical protein
MDEVSVITRAPEDRAGWVVSDDDAARGRPADQPKRVKSRLWFVPVDSAAERVSRFLSSLDTEVREVAPGEWGLVLDAAGYVLDVGVAIRGSLLRAQAAVLPPGVIDPHQLLYWNRQAPLVCFAENRAGEVFVCGELPLECLEAETLDRFLGLLLASATRARQFAIERG